MALLAVSQLAGSAAAASAAGGVFNPLAYGAAGDGVTDDTTAIRATFAAAAAAGGGEVFVPSNYTFLTGSFNLSSNLVVTVAGTLLGYSNCTTLACSVAHYPLIPPLPWYGGGQDCAYR